jgi:hypothetical protein
VAPTTTVPPTTAPPPNQAPLTDPLTLPPLTSPPTTAQDLSWYQSLYQRDAAQYIQAAAALPTGPDVSPSVLASSLGNIASAANTFANIGNDMLGSPAAIDASIDLGTALNAVRFSAGDAEMAAQRIGWDQQTVASDEQSIQFCDCSPGSLAYSELPAAQNLPKDEANLADDQNTLSTDLSTLGSDIQRVAAAANTVRAEIGLGPVPAGEAA